MPDAHPVPGDEPSGALLLRVWCDRRGDEVRLVARFLDWSSTASGQLGPPRYATGIDDITEAVRRWLTTVAGPEVLRPEGYPPKEDGT